MYKTLSLAVLLLAVFAFTSGSKSVGAVPPSPASPVIVARGMLTDQTKPFSATIYTPAQDGVFRLSVYATVNVADPNSNSQWLYSDSWSDSTGTVQNAPFLLTGNGNQLGQFGALQLVTFQGGLVQTIQANKSTPIVHSMGQASGPDNSAYSLYYVLERIE